MSEPDGYGPGVLSEDADPRGLSRRSIASQEA
jgi:hypothetical protein